MFKQQTIFSSGSLYAVAGDTILTPMKFGTLQDVSLDVSMSQKEVRGKNLFAEKIANSEGKLAIKAKFARINPLIYSKLFLGGAMTTGRERFVEGEAGLIPANPGPYTIVVANGATFKEDHGVYDVTTGDPYEKVAAAPATGQYSVDPATGTYTFFDGGLAVLIDYSWTDAATGHTVSVNNAQAGIAPSFQMLLTNKDDDGEFGVRVFSCSSSKLAQATKLGDFQIPEMDITAIANPAGQVLEYYTE